MYTSKRTANRSSTAENVSKERMARWATTSRCYDEVYMNGERGRRLEILLDTPQRIQTTQARKPGKESASASFSSATIVMIIILISGLIQGNVTCSFIFSKEEDSASHYFHDYDDDFPIEILARYAN